MSLKQLKVKSLTFQDHISEQIQTQLSRVLLHRARAGQGADGAMSWGRKAQETGPGPGQAVAAEGEKTWMGLFPCPGQGGISGNDKKTVTGSD